MLPFLLLDGFVGAVRKGRRPPEASRHSVSVPEGKSGASVGAIGAGLEKTRRRGVAIRLLSGLSASGSAVEQGVRVDREGSLSGRGGGGLQP